jgi:cytochrome oxidase Cu insertion factor (SCO1/SenC/PrrC family)
VKPLLILVAAVLLATAATNAQQPARTPIDVSKLGPQIGQRVPDFTLTDQYGARRTLPSIMGPKGAMLVFIRSADW